VLKQAAEKNKVILWIEKDYIRRIPLLLQYPIFQLKGNNSYISIENQTIPKYDTTDKKAFLVSFNSQFLQQIDFDFRVDLCSAIPISEIESSLIEFDYKL